MADAAAIHASLRALTDHARAEGKWLQCDYFGAWYTPETAEAEWEAGRLLWHPINWQLSTTDEIVAQLRARVALARHRLHDAEADLVRALLTLQAATPSPHPSPESTEPR